MLNMKSFGKSIAVAAALVLVLGPLMQINLLAASNAPAASQVCGTSSCCCCSGDNNESSDDDAATRECKCSISESHEPPEIEMVSSERQIEPDNLSAFPLAVSYNYAPKVSTHNSHVSISNSRAGKSPPAYILACTLLI